MKNKYHKKVFRIILFSIIFVSVSLAGFSQALGDVNGNGTVDIVDALLIAQYYVGLNPSGFLQSAGDTNCDSVIDIVDALLVAQYYVGLIPELSCSTPGPTSVSTPGPTTPPGELYTGNATWYYSLGAPYGGCGLGQSYLDSVHFVALNVQDSPGDYTTFLERPIPSEYADNIGMFDNGHNCGRWVRVTIGDYCNGINDGIPNEPFCHDGSGWVSDSYNGAVLNMIVADSCHDGNAWCRDDPYHIDLARDSLNQFEIDGVPVGDMDPDHWNNRQVHWEFIEAPNYTGDIRIGFILSAQIWWPVIAVTRLKNGIHGVDYYDGTNWVKAEMLDDMGQCYVIGPTSMVDGEPGNNFRIRVYDVNDQLINDGRIYNFPMPESCGNSCPDTFNEVTYTIE